MKKVLLAGVAALLISGPALATTAPSTPGFGIGGTIGGFAGNGTSAAINGGASVGGMGSGWSQSSGASAGTTGQVTAQNFRTTETGFAGAQQSSVGAGLGTFGFPGVSGIGVVGGQQSSATGSTMTERVRGSNVNQDFASTGSQFSNGAHSQAGFNAASNGFGFAMRGSGITGNVTGGFGR